MQQNTFLLYGANGYTGQLIAQNAVQNGLRPILAGRNKEAIEALASKLDLPFRIFDLSDTTTLENALQQVNTVIHAAGPYDQTARPMIEACLRTHTHYLDLNGDVDVFNSLQDYDQQAQQNSIMVLPGAGFDVVPTDCLALWLKHKLPDATHLSIEFAIIGSALSRGTAITTLQKLGMPGASRKNGRIQPEPMGLSGHWVHFHGHPKKQFVMSIPWGDLSTAFFSTGIPNIQTYTGITKTAWLFLKGQTTFNWLLRTRFIRNLIHKIIHLQPTGPGEAIRNKATSLIQATVTNANGTSVKAAMQTPEAYALTASAIIHITQKILEGQFKPGYQTPASAYGPELIMEIPGVTRQIIPN